MAVRALKRSKVETALVEKTRLAESDIREKIDEAVKLQDEIKLLSTQLSGLKDEIRDWAKDRKKHEILTDVAKARIDDQIVTEVKPEAVQKWLKKHNKLDLLPKLSKISITEARKYLGDITIDAIGKTTRKAFSRLTISRL